MFGSNILFCIGDRMTMSTLTLILTAPFSFWSREHWGMICHSRDQALAQAHRRMSRRCLTIEWTPNVFLDPIAGPPVDWFSAGGEISPWLVEGSIRTFLSSRALRSQGEPGPFFLFRFVTVPPWRAAYYLWRTGRPMRICAFPPWRWSSCGLITTFSSMAL